MRAWIMPRRGLIRTLAAALGTSFLMPRARRIAATEIKVADEVPEIRFDFETVGLESWTSVSGQWAIEEMADAPSGRKVLVQRATRNEFNVIVAPPGPFTDFDVTMKFKPISGREDASGGIVFRFNDGKYYVARANALEDNFRLYAYDRGRAREDTVPRAVARGSRDRDGRSHPGLARRREAPRPSRFAIQVRAGGAVDEGRFDHGLRRSNSARCEGQWLEKGI
jgi:hypothetical protein